MGVFLFIGLTTRGSSTILNGMHMNVSQSSLEANEATVGSLVHWRYSRYTFGIIVERYIDNHVGEVCRVWWISADSSVKDQIGIVRTSDVRTHCEVLS
jgi:hypothetical protein